MKFSTFYHQYFMSYMTTKFVVFDRLFACVCITNSCKLIFLLHSGIHISSIIKWQTKVPTNTTWLTCSCLKKLQVKISSTVCQISFEYDIFVFLFLLTMLYTIIVLLCTIVYRHSETPPFNITDTWLKQSVSTKQMIDFFF